MASCEPISAAELQTLLSQQERTQRRWAELGSTFWLKLVISKRSDILTKCAQYQNISLEFVYIDLLKMLVGKSYGKIHKHFSDISLLLKCEVNFKKLSSFLESKTEKQQKFFTEILKHLFGATFIEISPWWLSRCFELHRKMCGIISENLKESETEFVFEIPKSWTYIKEENWPFEVFLRSRWADELFTILNCNKKMIGWWSGKPEKETLPPKKSDFDHEILQYATAGCTFSYWLVPYTNTFYKGEYEGGDRFFQYLKQDGNKILNWELLELSIPPMWVRNHYQGPLALTNSYKSYEGLHKSVWVATWLNSFEVDFMAVLQETQQEFLTAGAGHIEDGLSWKDRMVEYKKTLEYMHSLPSSPALQDREYNADFLLEPALLMQLPWHHNLLQLWLAAALMEVTRFEAASMELRHWAVPELLESLVTGMLQAVKQCKERVLLGLALLCREVSTFPQMHPTYPTMLMEHAIIPATQFLKFMLRGLAYKFLGQLKRAAWCRNSKVGPPTRSVPPSAYTIHPDLSAILYEHFFHLHYWMDNKLNVPYSVQKLNFNKIISELKQDFNEKDLPHGSAFHMQNLSFEEALCEMGLHNFTPKGNPCELVKEISQDVFSKPPTTRELESAERHALLAIKIAEFMSGLQKEDNPSLLRCLVRLTGEALVREQEVRVAAICAQASATPMMLHDLPVDMDWLWTYTIHYAEAKVLLNSSDGVQSWLQKQLPDYWTRPMGRTSDDDDDFIRGPIFDSQSKKEFFDSFDQICCNIMFRSQQLYQFYEAKKQCKSKVQLYLFHCLPSSFFLWHDIFVGNYKGVIVDQIRSISLQYIKCALFNQYNTLRFQYDKVSPGVYHRAAISMHPLKVQEATAHIATAKICFENHMATFNMLADFCMVHKFNLVDDFMNGLQLGITCFKDNKPRHKMEMLLWKGWHEVFRNQWYGQKFQMEMTLFLPPMHRATTSLGRLVRVRDVLTSLSHLMIVSGEFDPRLKALLPYQVLKKMQPTLLEQSKKLFQYFLFNETIPDNFISLQHLGIADKDKVSKQFMIETQDLFVKVFGLVFEVKEKTSLVTVKLAEELISEMQRNKDIQKFLFKPNFKMNVAKELKLRVPKAESHQSEVNMVTLANQFLDMSLEAPAAPQVERAINKLAKLKEVCFHCKKRGENFVTFDGKFYCSEKCRKLVQKDAAEGKTRQWCRYCKKKEKPDQKFLLCKECQEDEKYPEPNYFCSTECENTWWNKEHHAEHLEFELGLGKWYVPPPPQVEQYYYEYYVDEDDVE